MEESLPPIGSGGDRKSHPLLEELKGIVERLKECAGPVIDGSPHLIPLCETLEAILRHGLKYPNSWFGLNKQDYWSWIEPLQDYYFNQKENPLLREVVQAIAKSQKCRSVVGSGRCFIRVALCQRLISVPIEHLAQNKRLTQYWYSNDSIIGSAALRENLMGVLFEVTDIDFQLSVNNSSFLDESWVIPVYQSLSVAPIKTLNVKLSYVDDRALVVEMEKGCLAEGAGLEVGDVLDELCGTPVAGTAHGKLKQILVANSIDSTDFVIVKKHLSDGCLFLPILQRQVVSDERAGIADVKYKGRASDKRRSHGHSTEYSLVFLGRDHVNVGTEPTKEAINGAIQCMLTSSCKPQESVLSVSSAQVALSHVQAQEVVSSWQYSELCSCGRGEAHQTCLVLLVMAQGGGLCAYVMEAQSNELAQAICEHIAQGFNGPKR